MTIKGIISHTHLSDIIRIALLATYGGLWLDSTVLCTGNLDKYITDNSELFVFSNAYRGDKSIIASSWLIYAKANNPIIVNTRNLIYKYWEKENKLKEYFLFHLMFTIVCRKLDNEWQKIPVFTNINPHLILFTALHKQYNKEKLDVIKQQANFHKLSYKCDFSKFENASLYEHILKGDH